MDIWEICAVIVGWAKPSVCGNFGRAIGKHFVHNFKFWNVEIEINKIEIRLFNLKNSWNYFVNQASSLRLKTLKLVPVWSREAPVMTRISRVKCGSMDFGRKMRKIVRKINHILTHQTLCFMWGSEDGAPPSPSFSPVCSLCLLKGCWWTRQWTRGNESMNNGQW